MDRFRFNTAISKLMVLTNEMRTTLDAGGGARRCGAALAQMLAPFAPFAAEELWREVLGERASVHRSPWPSFDPALVARGHGHDGDPGGRQGARPRGGAVGISEEDAVALARASRAPRARAMGGRAVAKEIVRAPRLVNLVDVAPPPSPGRAGPTLFA